MWGPPFHMHRIRRSPRGLLAIALLLPCVSTARGQDRRYPSDRELLARFAPVVILAPGERALPASVDWYLARARLDPDPAPSPRVTQATLLGVDWRALLRQVGRKVARLRPNYPARPGSSDPRNWVVYGHVYPAQDGGTLLQYWFFYPFNDFHVLFDHEGDWEHVTLRLDASGRPVGAWYARHERSAPGRWFEWKDLQLEGEHPVVLAARGSHASYADAGDVRWYDRSCAARVPSEAQRLGCTVWRTWARGTGGVVATGPRERPLPGATFVMWPGEWGTLGWFGRDTGGPHGPAYQSGWCSMGTPGCS